MRFLINQIRRSARTRLMILAGLCAIAAWRMVFAVPQPYIDQEQLAQFRAKQAQIQSDH